MPKKPSMCQRADGRYVKSITDPRTGKKRYFYGQTPREVNLKILAFSEKQETGRTFAEIADEWWGEALERIAYQTQKSYKPALRRAIAEFGPTPIKDIKPKDINKFLHSLKDSFSAKSLANQRLILNLIFNSGLLSGDIEINPCTAVKTPQGERHIRTAATPTDEEKVKASTEIWLFPYFALMSGMRKGEILALQWKDINFEENYIEVSKSVYHIGDRPAIKSPKTAAGVRIVPLLAPLKEKLLAISKRNAESFIFSDDGKTPLTDRRYATLYSHFQ